MHRLSWVVVSMLSIAAAPGGHGAEQPEAILSIGEGWQSALVAHELEPAAPPDFDRPTTAELERVDLWYGARLPGLPGGPRVLVFASTGEAVDVWLDGRRVHQVEDRAASRRMSIHVVTLHDPGGRFLSIRLSLANRGTSIEGVPLLASPSRSSEAVGEVVRDLVWGDLSRVTASIILLVTGLAAVLISIVRWKSREHALLYFGLFATLYGARLLFDSTAALLLGVPQPERWFVISWITYLINVPAWFFAMEVLGRGWRSSVVWMTRIFVVLFFAGVVSDLVRAEPLSIDRINSLAVLVGAAVLIGNLARWETLRSKDGKIFTGGLAIFGVFAILENLRGLGFLDWDYGVEWVGFLTLCAALGWIALRRFVAGEAQLIEIEKELEMARSIQQSILPVVPPSSDRLEICARYLPMTAVAGDFYDYFEFPDGRIGVLVADVSGHGVPAAMVASMVKIAAVTQSEISSDPAKMMAGLNQALCGHLERDFVTATCLVFDPASSSVAVCNAGHPPPLWLDGSSVRPLGDYGILLGRFSTASYRAASIPLEGGDRILCFTDGIVEARNAEGDEYGYSRLEDRLRAMRDAGLDEMLDGLIREVESWNGASPQGDDLTLVAIDVGGARSE